MTKFKFLSDEWLTAVIELQAEYRDQLPKPVMSMRMNQVVSGAPVEGGIAHLHIDTTAGYGKIGKGHLETVDVTITTEYEVALALLVQNDQAAAMQAFMSGKIKVQGDMTKIMVPPPPPNEAQKALEAKIRELTE